MRNVSSDSHKKAHFKNDDVDRLIGGNLRRLRLQRSLSQAEVAAMLGISFQQIQKYERGTNRLAGSTLYLLSQCLDCSIVEFFTDLGANTGTGKPPMSAADGDLIHLLNAIPEDMKKTTTRLLKKFLAE